MINNHKDIVYHYCSVEVFLSIISNSVLWLSDITKSNDSKECSWINEIIKNKLYEYLNHNFPDKISLIQELEKVRRPSLSFYVGCFSENFDSQYHWSEYAQSGEGLAIGFSKTYLEEINKYKKWNPYSPYLFDKVIYNKEKHEKFSDKAVEKICKDFSLWEMAGALVNLGVEYALYKNPSFKDEKEWRIVCLFSSEYAQRNHFITGVSLSEMFLRGK